jgi:hypothetical protein
MAACGEMRGLADLQRDSAIRVGVSLRPESFPLHGTEAGEEEKVPCFIKSTSNNDLCARYALFH